MPGHGRGAVLADAGGAVFSLWQSATMDSGDFTMFEDFSIGWVELVTRDVDAAQRFCGSLLGWAFTAPGVGRIARIDDPTGAGCYLIELARGHRKATSAPRPPPRPPRLAMLQRCACCSPTTTRCSATR